MRRRRIIPIDATSGRSRWSFRGTLKVKGDYEREQNCTGEHFLGPVSHPHPAWLSLITLEGAILVLLGSNAGATGSLMQLGKNRGVKYIKEGISTVHSTKRVKLDSTEQP